MGQKVVKLARTIADELEIILPEKDPFRIRIDELRLQYLGVKTTEGEKESSIHSNNSHHEKEKDKKAKKSGKKKKLSRDRDVGGSQSSREGDTLSKHQLELLDVVADMLMKEFLAEPTRQTSFNDLIVKYNINRLDGEQLDLAKLKTFHIVLDRPVGFKLPPKKRTEKAAEQLREYIRKQIDELDAEDLQQAITRCEEDEEERLRREEETEMEMARLKDSFEQEIAVAKQERVGREERIRENEREALREWEEQRARMLQEERDMRKWREVMMREKHEMKRWREERAKLDRDDDLTTSPRAGSEWRNSYNIFIQRAAPTARTILKEHPLPLENKTIKPENDQFVVGDIVFVLGGHHISSELLGKGWTIDLDEGLQTSVPYVATFSFSGLSITAYSRSGEVETRGGNQQPSLKLTILQEFFFERRYGLKKMHRTPEQQSAMLAAFPNDLTVIQWLLHNCKYLPAFSTETTDKDGPEKRSSQPSLSLSSTGSTNGNNVRKSIEENNGSGNGNGNGNGNGTPTSPSRLNIVALEFKNPAEPTEQDFRDLRAFFRAPDFFRAADAVFLTEDKKAQGLVVRLVWMALSTNYPSEQLRVQFSNFALHNCSSGRYNSDIANSLFAILVESRANIVDRAGEEQRVYFNLPVVHPEAWQALFVSMRRCNFADRKNTLQDVSTLLYNFQNNCESLAAHDEWQDWLLELLVDLPKSKEVEPYKSLYAFTMNALALVHYTSCMAQERESAIPFQDLLRTSIKRIYLFSGYNHDSAAVVRAMLSSLVNLVASSANKFAKGTSAAREWQNLPQLISIARWFLFQASYWTPVPTGPATPLQGSSLALSSWACTVCGEVYPGKTARCALCDSPAPAADMSTGSMYCLSKNISKEEGFRGFGESDKDITQFGLHFNPTGSPIYADDSLLAAVMKLFTALRLGAFDPATEKSLEARCIAFFTALAKDSVFWNDAVTFTSGIDIKGIEKGRASGSFTYRKLAILTKDFLNAKGSTDRQQLAHTFHASIK